MYLSYPTIAVLASDKEVIKKIWKLVEEKHWKGFETEKISLTYFPCYFFATAEKAIAVNAVNGKPSETIAREFSGNSEKTGFRLEHDYKATAEKITVKKEEAEKKFGGKAKILYYPVWKASIKLGSGKFELQYSAVNGELFEKENIPERKRSATEIAVEAISELKKPEEWARNARELFSEAKKVFRL